MSDLATIRPHYGLGALRFGAEKGAVREYLGTVPRESVDDEVTWWDYDDLGIQAGFDSDEGGRLFSLSVERPESTLLGKRFIGLTEAAALQLASRVGLGAFSRGDLVFGWQAEFGERDLELCFFDGRCGSVSWRVYIGPDDRRRYPPALRALKTRAG